VTKRGSNIFTGFGFLSIVLWSSTVAFARSLSVEVGPVTAGALIYFIGGIAGVGWQTLTGRFGVVLRMNRRYLVGCGTLFGANITVFYIGLALARSSGQAIEVGLLNYSWPVLILVFSLLLLPMKARWAFIPGIAIAAVGIFFTVTQATPVTFAAFAANLAGNPWAYLGGLAAGVSWALYSVLSRKWSGDGKGNAVPLFMLVTSVVLGLSLLVFPETTTWTHRAVLELLFMAIGPNLAYILWEMAMRKGDIVLVASASYMTPLLATLIAVSYLGVPAGWKLWAGCALIIIGAVICRMSVRVEVPRS
jgi:drug/metabolite transporter (DMT)-like permease